jgi:FMN phosphatase YigB (HAD superfamily)
MRETPFGQVRAVGFDLDDTLCVYMPVAVQARRAMMERYLAPQTGLPIETLDQHYKRAFHSVLEELHTERWYPLYLREGRATRTETFRRLLASLNLDADGLAERISEEYAALREQMLHLHEETLEVLHALRATLPAVCHHERSRLRAAARVAGAGAGGAVRHHRD